MLPSDYLSCIKEIASDPENDEAYSWAFSLARGSQPIEIDEDLVQEADLWFLEDAD